MPKNINTNFDYNEEVKKCKTIDDVMGKNGLISIHKSNNWYEVLKIVEISIPNYRT